MMHQVSCLLLTRSVETCLSSPSCTVVTSGRRNASSGVFIHCLVFLPCIPVFCVYWVTCSGVSNCRWDEDYLCFLATTRKSCVVCWNMCFPVTLGDVQRSSQLLDPPKVHSYENNKLLQQPKVTSQVLLLLVCYLVESNDNIRPSLSLTAWIHSQLQIPVKWYKAEVLGNSMWLCSVAYGVVISDDLDVNSEGRCGYWKPL